MGQPVIQTSFNAGEWAPALNARVDLAKYHSGAALLRNFFVDYRGGATTRPGTKYVLQGRSSTFRLIPFTASFTVTYVLEFGPGYIRFYNNGAPVLETATSITAATPGTPEVFTDTAHGYSNNDWLFIQGNYYIVQNVTTNTFTLTDLFGNAINTNPFTLPAAPQRVYTLLNSPYQAADLQQIKFAQDANFLFLCHPNYAPQILTLNSATNWTLAAINFLSTIATPTFVSHSTTFAAGGQAVGYAITAVDINGQESSPLFNQFTSIAMSGVAGTNVINIGAVTGAVSYNLYRSQIDFTNTAPGGSAQYGFVANFTGTRLYDSNVVPNFALGPPILQDPFSGSSVQSLILGAGGTQYSLGTTLTISGGGGTGASGFPIVDPRSVTGVTITSAGNIVVSDGGPAPTITPVFSGGGGSGAAGYCIIFKLFDTGGFSGWGVSSVVITNGGSGYSSPPSVSFSNNIGSGTPATGTASVSNGAITGLVLTSGGAGFTSAPSITFNNVGSGSGASATTTIGAAGGGNPTVPALIQQRSFFGGLQFAPAQFNLSQPGAPFNFNVSFPTQDSDAIQGTLTANTLHSIKSALAVSAGLIVFSDKAAWLINGGAAGAAIGATTILASPQGYSGANDVPPIPTPNDILYVQAKGDVVRDLQFNFYVNNYIGSDISILSSHLFYGFQILQWAWAEEPFKVAWVIRNDGTLLSLTFIKEQELIAWTHHDTQGSYMTVASVNEATAIGNVDAVYVGVTRTINGQTVSYIERMVELNWPVDYKSSWQVDAGIGYNGNPATTFSGAQHLGGKVVTGVADGVVINFTMPVSGTFVFGPGGTTGLTGIANASIVTVGLAFTPQIQTLALDLGGEGGTVQSKRKKVGAVTARVANALGLSAGKTLATVQPMKDLIIGNIGSMSNALITGLQTTDSRIIIDPSWDVFGQYFIVQPNPYPATVLGLIPEIVVGDTK